MAINFLNSVDLNQNQLIKAAIESQPNDATAGTGVDGQLYYDSTLDKVKVWTGSAWESISGDLTALTEGTYINIDNPSGPIPTINHDLTTRPANSETTASPASGGTFTVIDSVTTNTTGHVTRANTKTITLPAEFDEKYTLPTTVGVVSPGTPTTGIISLTGTTEGVASTVTFTGTTNRINVAGSAVDQAGVLTIDLTDDVTIADDLTVTGIMTQLQTGETNTLASPLDMSTNKIENVETGTDPTDGVNLGQVQLLVNGIGVFQGGYDATNDPGSPNISGSSNVKLDLGDYFVVTHDGDITFSGTTTTGVNSGALDNSTALLLTAANADIEVGMDVTGTGVPPNITIASITNTTNFVLSSAITIVDAVTLTFSDKVVKVEVGDFIFADAAIAAGSNPAKSAYTIVQSDANIAGAGATDGATEKGVAGFDSASFDVSASGWVQLNSTRNPYGARIALNNTAPVVRTTTGSNPVDQTTFTVNIDDASIFGAGALAANVKVEVLDKNSPQGTVYPLVERSGSGSLTVKFSGDVAINIYQVLLSHV